tara:strand:- start:11 stop:811 length:801 start_codon:yes stop_codon:yes gene_type:complete
VAFPLEITDVPIKDRNVVCLREDASLITAGAPEVEMTFAYDSEGRRIRKVVEVDGVVEDDLCYLWDGWLLLAEIDGVNRMPVRTYAWGPDVSASLRATGGVGGLAYARDWERIEITVPLYGDNGNVRAYWSVDEEALVAEYDYGAFGEPLQVVVDGAREFPFRFSTKYTDSHSGLLYYGFRYYDPVTGRWLSRDPIEERGGLNLYAFVGNDGINAWDLLGEKGSEQPEPSPNLSPKEEWDLSNGPEKEQFSTSFEREGSKGVKRKI